MEYSAKRLVALAIGLVTCMVGMAAVLRGATTPPGESAAVMLAAATFYLLLGGVLLTTRLSVRVNRETGCAVRVAQYFMVPVEQAFLLDSFKSVGVGSVGNCDKARPRGRYFVQLVGATSLSMPGTSRNLQQVQTQARNLSRYLDLPCESRPRKAQYDGAI